MNNKKISADEFHASVERQLSGLKPDPWLAQRIEASEKEEKSVKKISATFILLAAIICVSVTALAAGLIFSRKVDDMTLASRELEKAYGITSTMQGSYFVREVEQTDQETVVSFAGLENLRYVLGEYTVTVKDGKATAIWSRDGEDTAGGFEADAWGVEQLNAMLDWDKNNRDPNQPDYYPLAAEIAQRHQAEYRCDGMPSEDEINTLTKLRQEEADQSRSVAKLTEKEMIELARQAIASVYNLTDDQMNLLKCFQETGNIDEDTCYYGIEDEKPVFSVWFNLCQGQTGSTPGTRPDFVEKDGIYVVDVNVETGVIESTLYDSGLCANE
ncbi:hypothetical protein [Aristaeella lactis]|uniref:Uncharacterized protein n=1 Tax=Aristaeella lactis TaxID=3046383 RepID=A0AC61PMY7_9FIRM|nr:hypothetical protein [Aristaeella lactis]QUA52763.1 hypothetical protein JYE50_13885 [Aristaeella lactis]SMC73115.1 hypothetical protein SAMN06297397_2234 [Aristaeella lactis]